MKIVKGADLKYLPASHEDPVNPGVLKKILLSKNDLIQGRIQMINWALLPGRRSFRKHFHTDMEEIFIMISGRANMIVGDISLEVMCGDTVVVPIDQPHKMINTTSVDVEYIVIGVTTMKNGKTILSEE